MYSWQLSLFAGESVVVVQFGNVVDSAGSVDSVE